MLSAEELVVANQPSLSFSDQCLGDQGVRQLCAILQTKKFVTAVDLRGCHVHGEGAAALAELLLSGAARLESISLEWNSLGTSDVGPRALEILLL